VSVERPGETPRPFTLPRPMTPAEFADRHLGGKACIGVYVVDPANQSCYCSAADFDDHGGDGQQAVADARTVYQFLVDNSFSPLLEISQSGTGAHVWICHTSAIPAASVREFWKAVLRQCEVRGEIFPKQSAVDGLEKGLGNYIRIPLWGASHFESVTGDVLDPVDLLKSVQKTTPYALQSRTEAWYTPSTECGEVLEFQGEGLPERVKNLLNHEPDSLLARRWALDTEGMLDASRSGIVQAIATELVRKFIPTPEIEASLKWWMEQQRYSKDSRWLHQTILKAYNFVQGLKQQESTRAATMCGMVHRVADSLDEGVIIPTDILSLDASIWGVGLGELCYYVARPGGAKTAWALELLDAASANGFPGLFLSLEMSQRPIGRRVLTRMGYDVEKVAQMNMVEVHKTIDRYYESRAPLYFLEDVRDLKSISDTIRNYVSQKGVKIVAIDHQGCIQTGISNEYESINRAVVELANLKKELDIAIVVLAHLSREYDVDRGRPKMRHLRGSGYLENYADLIIAGRWLFTEAPDIESNKNRYLFHVLKCRNREAKSADVEANFFGQKQKFA
jgi:KaiC/GvpD/RAD55 family RecA-like ATPase